MLGHLQPKEFISMSPFRVWTWIAGPYQELEPEMLVTSVYSNPQNQVVNSMKNKKGIIYEMRNVHNIFIIVTFRLM